MIRQRKIARRVIRRKRQLNSTYLRHNRFRHFQFQALAPWRELERIHENADCDFLRVARRLARDPDQFPMAILGRFS